MEIDQPAQDIPENMWADQNSQEQITAIEVSPDFKTGTIDNMDWVRTGQITPNSMRKDQATPDNITNYQCFLCNNPAKFMCPTCEKVYFCSEDHGRLHCREEFDDCFPYRVDQTDGVGRQLVTTRDVRMGEVLYLEDPIVVGPSQECDPICLSCLAAIDTSYLCNGCGYPMCDEECAADHQNTRECSILANTSPPSFEGEKNDAYHCILPLRVLLQQSDNEDRARLAELLMDHDKERTGQEYWEFSRKNIVPFIQQSCMQGQWSHDQIMRAVGILEVNAYEINSRIGCGTRGLFPLSSLVNHNCVPNCRMVWSTEAPYQNKVVAAQDIKAGDEIYTSYLRPSMCSLIRRKTLKEGW